GRFGYRHHALQRHGRYANPRRFTLRPLVVCRFDFSGCGAGHPVAVDSVWFNRADPLELTHDQWFWGTVMGLAIAGMQALDQFDFDTALELVREWLATALWVTATDDQ